MNRRIIFIIIIAILLIGAIGGYFYWAKLQKTKTTELTPENIINESATRGVLPSVGANPLGSKPDLNPANKANPFKDIKINPFE